MAKVSLSQAAKDTGVSLPTLSRWRKSGKISADKNGSGGYIIDTSEYDRIEEFKKQSRNMKGITKGLVKGVALHNETPNEMRVLRVEVEVLRERIKDKDEIIEDIREDRNEWKKQAKTLLLQNPIVRSEKPLEDRKENLATPLTDHEETLPKQQNSEGLRPYLLLLVTLAILGSIFWLTLQPKKENLSTKSISKSMINSPSQSPIPNSNFYFQPQPSKN